MSYPENLRALSMAGSFAWQIAIGIKPIEYRPWPINSLRGLVLLHTSQTNWDDTWDEFIDSGDLTLEQTRKAKGCIVGAGFLVGLETYGTQNYGHVFDGCLCFAPEDWIPAPGARNYWRAQKPQQQAAFSRAWELAHTGQWSAIDPDHTLDLMEQHGFECEMPEPEPDPPAQSRIFLAGPGGNVTEHLLK